MQDRNRLFKRISKTSHTVYKLPNEGYSIHIDYIIYIQRYASVVTSMKLNVKFLKTMKESWKSLTVSLGYGPIPYLSVSHQHELDTNGAKEKAAVPHHLGGMSIHRFFHSCATAICSKF